MPEIDGVRHREVTVDGVRLHVAEAGEGPPIVLQHGWPQNWWAWRELIGPLSAGNRVICPDLRGLGWSQSPPDGDYGKERMASDLLGLLDALGLDRVRLVGHDWGGFAGYLACLRAPERFSGYLAMGISHPWPAVGSRPDPLAFARLWYQFVLASPVLARQLLTRRAIARGWLQRAGRGAWDDRALDVYAERLSGEAGSRATVGIYRTFLTRELLPLLRGRYAEQRLRVPTRHMLGEDDPVITVESLQGYEAHADDMTVEVVPGVGHWLPEECPQRVLAAIEQLP